VGFGELAAQLAGGVLCLLGGVLCLLGELHRHLATPLSLPTCQFGFRRPVLGILLGLACLGELAVGFGELAAQLAGGVLCL
ncbi:hypothetical protein, partial [Streptomyces sp. XY511]|uniref:hypothetical protein n=1 Tax=Streptomyces sp. XY511 TaxID=1519480 RepID=UPI00131E4926